MMPTVPCHTYGECYSFVCHAAFAGGEYNNANRSSCGCYVEVSECRSHCLFIIT